MGLRLFRIACEYAVLCGECVSVFVCVSLLRLVWHGMAWQTHQINTILCTVPCPEFMFSHAHLFMFCFGQAATRMENVETRFVRACVQWRLTKIGLCGQLHSG